MTNTLFNKNTPVSLAIILIGLIPLSSERLESIFAIIFSLLVVFTVFLKKKIYNKKIGLGPFIINSTLFLVLLITFLNGINKEVFRIMETRVSLIVFPILMYFISVCFNRNEIIRLFNTWKTTFFISCVLFSLIALVLFSIYANPWVPKYGAQFFQYAVLDHPYFSRHPGYLSVFLNISVLIGVNNLIEKKSILSKMFYGIGALLSAILIFLFSIKIAIVALIFSFFALVIIMKIKRTYLLSLFSLLLLAVTILFIKVPDRFNRFAVFLNPDIVSANQEHNSVFLHKQTIVCAMDIFNKNLIKGVGIENSKSLVNDCVRETYLYSPNVVYNSHNQYLGYALNSGIIGLLILFFVSNNLHKS